MYQAVDLAMWKAEGSAEAHRSGDGWVIRLTAKFGGKAAKLCFPLPASAQGKKVRACARLRLLDPWSENVTFGIADSGGEVTTLCKLTVDKFLSRVVIEKQCDEAPELFFATARPFVNLTLYLEDVTVEERGRRVQEVQSHPSL
jgi:hypothetical protein